MILCVAEKPSVSKTLSYILSDGSAKGTKSKSKYITNYEMILKWNGMDTSVIITSVLGHLYELDFGPEMKKWQINEIQRLFESEVYSNVSKSMKDVAENIRILARKAKVLFIWTDCDSEGEFIGYEIYKHCLQVQRAIVLKRARFCSLNKSEIFQAWRSPVNIDMKQVDAVECRMELDLRVGSAFTRFQTLSLQGKLNKFKKGELISYGGCQIPTLNFVVERYLDIKNFVPEEYHKIELSVQKSTKVDFLWERDRIFDRHVAVVFYQICLDDPKPRIIKVNRTPTEKWTPLPLTTVEMQKLGVKHLHIPSHDIMTAAESLYSKGFISYPRTETDYFPPSFPLKDTISKQTKNPLWGEYAETLLSDKFRFPRKGKHNDEAHPPIYPIISATNLTGNEKKLYELITRHFLACCSHNAKGEETRVKLSMGNEIFTAKGLVIHERNYLDVYPYDKWAAKTIPNFEEGEVPQISSIMLKKGTTTPPTLLTEADLISSMETHHIGTDATIHEHIKKILDRSYAVKKGTKGYITPTPLGLALITSYDDIKLSVLSKPSLRQKMESDLKEIKSGNKYKRDIIKANIGMYKTAFQQMNASRALFSEAFAKHISEYESSPIRDFAAPNETSNGNED